MNKNMLVGIMKMHGDTQAVLASEIGISTQSFNAKINEKRGTEFRRSEIQKIKERYDLDDAMIGEIFFSSIVS